MEISDNIISGTTRPTLVENSANALVSGVNNWLKTNAAPGSLIESVQTTAPGFRNPALGDYSLAPGSACVGTANPAPYGLPGKEYYLNETSNRMWRPRAAARDIGAFESSTTGPPVNAYALPPRPILNAVSSGSNAVLAWPLFAQDFQLEQTDLISSSWSSSPYTYVTNLSGVFVSIPARTGRQIFRLWK
ncbi:MAG TPA: hypothetical protein VL361_11930 [Candidatus Limnocylindrales bacterium]|nr:hypothetical protein [Candidatus Limnocylindrales bacterium]